MAADGIRCPFIVVHDLSHADAALRTARAGAKSVALLSARHAAATLGAPAFLAMIERAAAEAGTAPTLAAIDCGDAAGLAMSALRAGADTIVFDPASPAAARITSLAEQFGAAVLQPDIYDGALDLASVGDVSEACHTWFRERSVEE